MDIENKHRKTEINEKNLGFETLLIERQQGSERERIKAYGQRINMEKQREEGVKMADEL